MKVAHNAPTRITSQQQAIYQLIKQGRGHQTADDVYQVVRRQMPRISLATVYRNLDKLAQQGLITKVIIGGVSQFEPLSGPHYHVVCLGCRRLDNLQTAPVADIEDFFSRTTDYRLTGHDVVLYGLCPNCQRQR